MKSTIIIFFAIIVFSITSCTNRWEEHFNVTPDTVAKNVWEAMKEDPQISKFVELLEANKLDTLFQSDIAYTVFAPSNKSFETINFSVIDTSILLGYHIVSHFIQSESIGKSRQVMTLSKKYAIITKNGTALSIDGVPVSFESSLYRNGKYFVVDKVVTPLPSLYEFFEKNNHVLSEYIDSHDSIVLDLANSKPIGFNTAGNTVFDSVTVVYNRFEEQVFPVRKEFRNKTATFVFPLANDYNSALDKMAVQMGYTDRNNIPSLWQQKVLVPYLVGNGTFENMLEPEDFVISTPLVKMKMKNIVGDSVIISYRPTARQLCSNGYVYNYENFEIPDSLYNKGTRFELEDLLVVTGINKFAWDGDLVKVNSSITVAPFREFVPKSSNDSIVRALFPPSFNGTYSMEFESPYLFPRKYILVLRTLMDIGGIYNIYVNDKLVRKFDYYDYVIYKTILPSVVAGQRYIPFGRYNSFDMYVDNIVDYSKAKIKIEYAGPGRVASLGFVMDYLEFIPVKN
jgi:uncharacterized surface protein with fasciclin (FAS1) repeats